MNEASLYWFSRALPVIGAAGLTILSAVRLQGEELEYKVVAAQGQTATGSGMVDGRADGVFFYATGGLVQFLAPSAGGGGFSAFRGWATWPPAPPLPASRRGSWGAGPNGLSLHILAERPAPGTPGGITGIDGDVTINESGDVAFGGNWAVTTGPAPRPSGSGIWWARTEGPAPALVPVAISGTTGPGATTPFTNFILRPWHNGGFIGFLADGAAWTFNKSTQELRRFAWPSMPVPSFGAGMTVTNSITILAMDGHGRLVLRCNASDGNQWTFRAGGTLEVMPVFRPNQPAPGVPGKKIGGYSVGVNHLEKMAVGAYLTDDDGIFANDFSVIYYGPEDNLQLLVRGDAPPPGVPAGVWGGPTYLSRKGHIFAAGGMFKLPDTPQDSLTFTAIPVAGYTGFSINALGQIAATRLVNNLPSLWLYNPGDGWREVARQSLPLPLPGGSVNADSVLTLMGSGGADGIPTALGNDGRLVFSIGSRIVSVDANPATGFVFHSELGSNWHATGADPPTNWNATDGTPRGEIPGDVEQDTAEVSIPAQFFVALTDRAAPIGALNCAGRMAVEQALTVHRDSTGAELTITGASGRLNVDGAQFEATSDWRVQTAASISLTNATLISRKLFDIRAGLVSAAGSSSWKNYGLLEKSDPGLFEIKAPLHGHAPSPANAPYGVNILEGTLALTGGGSFNEVQHNLTMAGNNMLRMTGEWTVQKTVVFQGSPARGLLELGDSTHDVRITAEPALDTPSAASFHFPVNFRRGELRSGERTFNCFAPFTWNGGAMTGGVVDISGTPVGGFRFQGGGMEIPRLPAATRTLTGVLINRGAVTHEGPVTLDDGILIQDTTGAVWTMRAARMEGPPGGGLILNREGRIVVEADSFIHARYTDRTPGALIVKDALTMFGGADADGKIVLEDAVSEVRLESEPGGPRMAYVLHQGLGGNNDNRARVIVKGAELRLPKDGEGRFIDPKLILEDNSQLISDLTLRRAPITNIQEYASIPGQIVFVENVEWKGGVIGGGPVAKQTVISQRNGGVLEIQGAAEHVLDAAFQVDTAIQRGPVTVPVNGRIIMDERYRTTARWTIAAPVNLTGAGEFRNVGTLAVEPDPPGVVDIGVPVYVFIGKFICGAPDRSNQGTVVKFTNTITARPAPGDTLNDGTWRVHSGAVLDLGGGPLHHLKSSATVELIGGRLTQLDPRRNEGHLILRSSNNTLQATGNFENNGRVEITDDAILHVQGTALNQRRIKLDSGGSMTVNGLFTQDGEGSLELGPFSKLNLPGGSFMNGHVKCYGGEIIGDVIFSGQPAPGASPGRLSVTGSVTLTPAAVLDMELAGTAAGAFDVVSASGHAALNGTLAVVLLNGYRPGAGDTFTIVSAGTVSGQFANAPGGQRLATADGYGSFLVNYTSNGVVLSAFTAIPNPAPSAVPQLPPPVILFAETTAPLLSFQLTGTAARAYRIESSTNLHTWAVFHQAVLSSGGSRRVEVPFDAALSPRYFRARAE